MEWEQVWQYLKPPFAEFLWKYGIGHKMTLLKKPCLSLQEFSRKVPTNQSGHRSGR
jgi:hypothetical protein